MYYYKELFIFNLSQIEEILLNAYFWGRASTKSEKISILGIFQPPILPPPLRGLKF